MYIMRVNANEALRKLVDEYPELRGQHIEIKIKQPAAEGGRYDPLTSGDEVLIQAEMEGACGQVYTFHPRTFSGTVDAVANLPNVSQYYYPVVVAVLNAAARKVGLIDRSVECSPAEHGQCARHICEFIKNQHGICRIGMIGFHPALLEEAAKVFGPENLAVMDLNPHHIGLFLHGVEVWDGDKDYRPLVDFADVLLIAGANLVNGKADKIFELSKDKPYYFFGTTAAGLARVNDLPWLCPMSV
jgi:uncharacterized protein (DUF4213/DUF364 family)